MAAGNAHLIERLARRLEGGCQAVGAEAAGRLAQAVESAGRLRGPDAAGAAVEALTRELDRLARFVAKPDWMEAAR